MGESWELQGKEVVVSRSDKMKNQKVERGLVLVGQEITVN